MKFINACLLLVFGTFLIQSSCVPACDSSQNDEVGDEYFTVEYQDASGNNLLDTKYNHSGIVVYLDTAGGNSRNPEYELISPGFENGKFGPFRFTERYVNPANETFNSVLLMGRQYEFDYFIKKDTYGVDTLRVSFLLDVDECRFYWRSIQYSLNGNPLTTYDGQRQAEIIVTE